MGRWVVLEKGKERIKLINPTEARIEKEVKAGWSIIESFGLEPPKPKRKGRKE